MKNKLHYQFWPAKLTKTLTVPETTLYENLQTTAKRYPNKIAIQYYGASITYEQLLKEVEQLAGYLEHELRINKGDHVLLFMQNSPQFLISLFAIVRVRAVVIPINPMSVTDELKFYIDDAHIKSALVSQELYPKVKPLHDEGLLDDVIVTAYSEYVNETKTLDELPPEMVFPLEEDDRMIAWSDAISYDKRASVYEGDVQDIAMIPYTSGTTGKPKGCVHTNETIQSNIVGSYHWMNMTSDSVILTTLPLFHVTGLVHSALAPMYAGSEMALLTRWDKEYAIKAIETFKVTHWINISTMLIDFLSNEELESYDVSSLVLVGGGGAPLPEAIGKKLQETTGLDYVEGYGLSETMSHTHFNPPQRPKLQCLGIPAFSVDARIIDLETMEELGTEEEGELVVNGPQMFKEYYNNAEETEKSFIYIDEKPFFRTGDIAKMDEDGYFFIVDRLKRMINAAGFKVWPTEVESVLYGHPAIHQACVISAPDEVRGETVKAVVTLREPYKGKVTEEEIIEWSKDKLATYKVPRIVQFRDELPMTSSGKILWRTLQEETEVS